MRQLVPKIAEATRAERASLMLLDDVSHELTVRAAVGLPPEAIASRVALGRPIAGWVALHGRPLLLASGSEQPAEIQRAMRRREITSALSVPVSSERRVIGVLNVARLNGHPFAPPDLRSTALLGERIGLYLEAAQLHGALERRQALSATTSEERSTGLLVVDGALRVVSANPGFLRATGLDASQAIGRELRSVLPWVRHAADLEGRVHEALGAHRQVDGGQLIHRAPGLPVRVYSCRIHPLETGRGVERAIVMLEDITARERLADALAPAIAHELRNPLANALACAQLLLERPLRKRDRVDGLLRIRTSVQRAVAIVESLLRVATSAGPAIQEIDINDLLAGTPVLVDDRLTSQNVRLTMDLAPELPRMRADPVLLQQVFTNLVFNACAAMEDGGSLTVGTSVRDGMLEIRFADTGHGIRAEHLSRIFDPFFTTRGPAGTGLGLTISRAIVEQHRGTIEVHSQEGWGTTVTLRLPVVSVAASAA
ncbi:MAG: PAS domain-containing protein [Chloroflexi bacterium]|nr:PAS domain-containing protein [Chloroflexota bacterium]